jgi:hypothetical protein
MADLFPTLPEVPPEQTVTVTGPLRYEDVSQDGRLLLSALPHFMGLAVFQGLLVKDPAARAGAHAGIVPILTRLSIEGGGGPVSVRKPVTATGGFRTAHALSAAGEVDRLLLDTWASMTAPLGRTNPPRPPDAGRPIFVGRVFGEHVFTRPFAPRGERRVTAFAPGDWPEVPEERRPWQPAEAYLRLPAHATPLDEGLLPDEAPIVFGLAHTDSNQHVNSLVYPRLFEEAFVRRIAAHGKDPAVLARVADTAYRKPCFAGDRMRILLRAYQRGERLGAIGVFVREDDRDGRPHAVVRMET